MYYEYLFDLKVHYHYKLKHHKKYMTDKGLLKRFGFCILMCILNVMYLIVYGITYPVWALHEFLI